MAFSLRKVLSLNTFTDMALTMPKPISRKMHGMAADYPYAALTAAAPLLMGFKKEKTPALLAYILGGTTLLSSLFTRYEAGAVKKMPFKAHLTLDAVSGVTALAAPWLFGFAKSKRARNTFLGIGALALAVTLLTQTDNLDEEDDDSYED